MDLSRSGRSVLKYNKVYKVIQYGFNVCRPAVIDLRYFGVIFSTLFIETRFAMCEEVIIQYMNRWLTFCSPLSPRFLKAFGVMKGKRMMFDMKSSA